jgi:hypothetical protein
VKSRAGCHGACIAFLDVYVRVFLNNMPIPLKRIIFSTRIAKYLSGMPPGRGTGGVLYGGASAKPKLYLSGPFGIKWCRRAFEGVYHLCAPESIFLFLRFVFRWCRRAFEGMYHLCPPEIIFLLLRTCSLYVRCMSATAAHSQTYDRIGPTKMKNIMVWQNISNIAFQTVWRPHVQKP